MPAVSNALATASREALPTERARKPATEKKETRGKPIGRKGAPARDHKKRNETQRHKRRKRHNRYTIGLAKRKEIAIDETKNHERDEQLVAEGNERRRRSNRDLGRRFMLQLSAYREKPLSAKRHAHKGNAHEESQVRPNGQGAEHPPQRKRDDVRPRDHDSRRSRRKPHTA